MYDPKVGDLGHDAFGNQHPTKGYWLIESLERWSDDQPEGRKCKASEISQEVARYRNFKSPATHGPGRCARIVATDPRWHKQGVWLIKGKQPIDTPPDAIVAWINNKAPPRAQVIEFAQLYNMYAVEQGWANISARAIQPYLITAGYTIVARPNNRAIYAKTEWI